MISIPGFSEPFSSLSHLFAAFCFFLGGIFLIFKSHRNTLRTWTLIIYTFSLVFLFSMSGVYHLLEPAGTARYVLRHLDHAGIWILITGTFIPIHIFLFRGLKRWGVLFMVSTIAIMSITFEMVFFDNISELLSLAFFLSLGWFGIISIWLIKKDYSIKKSTFLIGGGLAYSIGAILDFARWPLLMDGVIGPHEVFHIFVLIGAGLHWWFVYSITHHPISLRLVVEVKENLRTKTFYAYGKNEKVMLSANTREELYESIQKWVNDTYSGSMHPEEIVIHNSLIL